MVVLLDDRLSGLTARCIGEYLPFSQLFIRHIKPGSSEICDTDLNEVSAYLNSRVQNTNHHRGYHKESSQDGKKKIEDIFLRF